MGAFLWQLFWPLIALIQWMRAGNLKAWKRQNAGISMIKWPVRLLTKLLDLLAVGEMVDAMAILFHPRVRKLSHMELREAEWVFGEDFPFWRVRILEESRWAKRWTKRWKGPELAFVVCRVIRFSRKIKTAPGNGDMQWLIHELVHVAQMESIGLQYIPEALYAQRTGGYDYGGAANLEGKRLWNFNREQQACIAADYYGMLKAGVEVPRQYRQYISDLESGRFVQ